LTLATGNVGCNYGDPTLPPFQVHYVAAVTHVTGPPDVDVGALYTYRIYELSGTLLIDTVITASPSDTVLMVVPPATYVVELGNLPSWCEPRYGTVESVVVYDRTNTSLARYNVTCKALLTLHVAAEGVDVDEEYVYRIVGDSVDRVGLIGAADTLRFDDIPPGSYAVELKHIAANCITTNDGSDMLGRPRLLEFESSYHGGAVGIYWRATDPERKIERYRWDITDCNGTSILPGGGQTRRGLTQNRARGLDTVVVVAGFEVGMPDTEVAGRCAELWVTDVDGNTTRRARARLGGGPGSPPSPTYYNAYLVGNYALRVELNVTDLDGDFVGSFAALRLRDGTLSPPDGVLDLGVYNTVGYMGAEIPDLQLGGRVQFSDIHSVIVYLVDRAGNMTRLEDSNVYR
jgi:hypothetical protein